MPKCHNFEWGDYRVEIRPLGWRNIFRFWPYLSGSDVSFRMNLRTKSNTERDFIFTRQVYRFDGQREYEVCEPYDYRNKPARELEHKFHDYLVTYGEYTIQVSLTEDGKSSGKKVIANFSVFERDKYVASIIIPIITAIVGAALVLVVQWLIAN